MNWYKISRSSIGESLAIIKTKEAFPLVLQCLKEIRESLNNMDFNWHDGVILNDSFELKGMADIGIEKFDIHILLEPIKNNVQAAGGVSLGNSVFRDSAYIQSIKRKDFSNIPFSFIIKIKLHIPLMFSEKDYSQIYFELLHALRHEIEHILSGQKNISSLYTEYRKSKNNILNWYYYLTDEIEIEAFVTGFYLRSQKTKIPLKNIMLEFLKTIKKDILTSAHDNREKTLLIIDKMINLVIDKWMDYAYQRFPNLKNKQRKKYELV
jgi:hypothetical protein